MIFHSLTYLVFLAVVLALYWSLPRRGQNLMLILASYIFYGWEHPWFLLPLWASTVVDYSCALGMERFPQQRRVFLVTSIVASVALLATFKYYAFALENANAILANFGQAPIRNTLRLALPAGLSFYTFQSIGYVVDVYRGRVKAVRDFPDYALYVTFFPQLVAGPIERAAHMLPQYRAPRKFDAEAWRTALGLILWGYFKKVVVADNAAVVANKIFGLTDTSFPVIWAGVFAFAVQIYADFSGYTDIARGTARLLGIDLMINSTIRTGHFASRFLAALASRFPPGCAIFLHPVGGSRCSTARASFNLMATFTISGLWHGASWNYVLWGVYWGLLILFQRFLGWMGLTQKIPWFAKVTITFGITCLGWLVFRERNLGQIVHDLAQSPFSASAEQWRIAIYFVVLVLFYALPLVVHMLATGLPGWRFELRLTERGRFILEATIAVLLLFGIVTIRSVATSDFIYFQF
jgi:D-alanyl-lipoteichoic acid acyltransferase DltB (MBOAT superfamily)